ncbi:hypothetical protein [Thermococcus sp.]|uniref:hypothetical protein n=1 Tax=Thermococcus sp. TaxID=35749 RepID=UPI00345CF178
MNPDLSLRLHNPHVPKFFTYSLFTAGERILRRENPMFLVGKWPLLFLNSGS